MNSRKIPKTWSRFLIGTIAIGIGCLLFSAPGWAQLTNYKTIANFSAAFEVPGSNPQVLPAGTYTFKMVESQGDRNIVQISNKDDTHVFTTILAIPIHRDVDTDRTVMTFEERGSEQPQAIRAWFYPHEKDGNQFVYSKTRATQLAKASNSPVPYSESAVNLAAPEAAALPVVAVAPAPIRLMQANGQSTDPGPYTQIAQAETAVTPATSSAAAPSPTPVQNVENTSLPKTAGNTPLFALVGCLFVIGGLSIKGLCGH